MKIVNGKPTLEQFKELMLKTFKECSDSDMFTFVNGNEEHMYYIENAGVLEAFTYAKPYNRSKCRHYVEFINLPKETTVDFRYIAYLSSTVKGYGALLLQFVLDNIECSMVLSVKQADYDLVDYYSKFDFTVTETINYEPHVLDVAKVMVRI